MRRFHLALAIMTSVALGGGALAADLELHPRKPLREIPVHQGPPNCSAWTDECVNCTRGAQGAAVCSNIGFACQPKPVRCTADATKK